MTHSHDTIIIVAYEYQKGTVEESLTVALTGEILVEIMSAVIICIILLETII